MLREGTLSKQHKVAQSHSFANNVLHTIRMCLAPDTFYIRHSVFFTHHAEDNLCLLRKICQQVKACLDTFRSKKKKKKIEEKNYFQWYEFGKDCGR